MSSVADESEPSIKSPEPEKSRPPVYFRELLVVLLLVILADLTIYRGQGFSGVAALLVGAPLLFLLGRANPQLGKAVWLLAAMLLLLAARLVWLGSGLGVACGLALMLAFALALHGRQPHVLSVLAGGFGTIAEGYRGLVDYGAWASKHGPRSNRVRWLAILLPIVAVVGFGSLFVLANPDLVTQLREWFASWIEFADRWWQQIPIRVRDFIFWGTVAWIAIGLLRPRTENSTADKTVLTRRAVEPEGVQSSLYVPVRNMLISVIALFAIYLVFEFRTLWFREFPKGFYYAGYAHQGAAWLTTALAIATLTLSLAFRGELLRDSRIGSLRTLAWIWSAENLVLALTVFNRLHIYIDFNGMTRMRTVALFGTATVVAGFLLVVWKIVRGHNFAWLIRHQLLALVLAVYVYALTPVDTIVHRHNVRRAMAGDLPPVVQITEHPVNSEGVMMLFPLVECEDPVVREGIRAMLAERTGQLESLLLERQKLGWTSFQAADDACLAKLRATTMKWGRFRDDRLRGEAIQKFKEYAYQWY